MNKNNRRITVLEMAPHIHKFLPNENKVAKISAWLINWINLSLESGKISPYDLLPLKTDLACHIGVSQGTIQNVYRIVEDEGIIESKQRIGSYIKPKNPQRTSEKLTSKRELAIEIIKKFILDNNFEQNSVLPSSRKLAQYTGLSNATIRLALNFLVTQNILELVKKEYVIKNTDFEIIITTTTTLVEKTATKMKKYILETFEQGDKLPNNKELARIFSVSVKTIHDSCKLLSKEGFLHIRRGQYGSVVIGESQNIQNDMYLYEKIESKIKNFIIENSKIEDRLPSIENFSEMFQVSKKTVKKALDNLRDEGYLAFIRGKNGGTFVTDIPQDSTDAYKWLAITPEYIENIEN